ncbi:hypothetical protein BOX15_Mlig001590g2, partial [Macrostomum lignano]
NSNASNEDSLENLVGKLKSNLASNADWLKQNTPEFWLASSGMSRDQFLAAVAKCQAEQAEDEDDQPIVVEEAGKAPEEESLDSLLVGLRQQIRNNPAVLVGMSAKAGKAPAKQGQK